MRPAISLKIYRRIILFVFLALQISIISSARAEDMLDRRSFTIEISGLEKEKPQSDTLSFQKGKLESSLSKASGYEGADYSATLSGGITQFSAVAASKDGGIKTWGGVIKGNNIEGTLESLEKVKEAKKDPKRKTGEYLSVKKSFTFKGSKS